VDLGGVRFNWNELARRDAMGAILVRTDARRWQPAEFFRTGEVLVEQLGSRAASLGMRFGGERALDLGCGVGRLARALVARFREVDAVDVSEEMLRAARRYHPDLPIRWWHVRGVDLSRLGERRYDLVLSFLTLQHVPPRDASALLVELARRVVAGGTLLVQVPTRSHTDLERLSGTSTFKGRLRSAVPSAWLERYRCARSGGPRMDMFGLPEDEVRAAVERGGCGLVAGDEIDDTQGLVPSRRYWGRGESPSAPLAPALT
jgi:SAM-dependent methyltransferase